MKLNTGSCKTCHCFWDYLGGAVDLQLVNRRSGLVKAMKILQTLRYMWRANDPELLIREEASTPTDSKSRLLPSLFEPAEPSHEEHGAFCCP